MDYERRARNVLWATIIIMVILILTVGKVGACDTADVVLEMWQNLSGQQSFGVVNDFNVIGAEVAGTQNAALNVKANGGRTTAGVSGKIEQDSFFQQGWMANDGDGNIAGQKTALTTDQTLKVWGEVVRKDPTLTANQNITGSLDGSFGVQDNQMLMGGNSNFNGHQELDITKTGQGNAGAVLTQSASGILEQGWVTPDAYQAMTIKNNVQMKTWGEVR